jgi:hypothetical protein
MMKTKRKTVRLGIMAGVLALTALFLISSSSPPVSIRVTADNLHNAPPFDFNDDFYIKNGVVPSKIPVRVGNENGGRPEFDAAGNHIWTRTSPMPNNDPTRRDVRVLETTGGFDKDGFLIYYSIMGFMNPATFATDASGNLTTEGARAMALAERFRAFIFPKTPRNPDGTPGNVILSPAPSNRRQDNMFETVDTYFCQNLLGLWQLDLVIYTQSAFTPAGQAVLAPIKARNGTDLDGTPVLKRLEEVTSLQAQGLVELRVNPPTGGQGPRWVI